MIAGSILRLVGLVSMGQGASLIGGAFMTGQTTWLEIGTGIALARTALLGMRSSDLAGFRNSDRDGLERKSRDSSSPRHAPFVAGSAAKQAIETAANKFRIAAKPWLLFRIQVSVTIPGGETNVMKWIMLNAFGGLTWLAGLSFAKGTTLPDGDFLTVGDHRMLVGMSFGFAGLLLLLWANLQSTT